MMTGTKTLPEPEFHSNALHVSMDCRVFTGSRPEDVVKDVSSWLASERVRIRHVGQSQCERNGNLLFVLTVFYE